MVGVLQPELLGEKERLNLPDPSIWGAGFMADIPQNILDNDARRTTSIEF